MAFGNINSLRNQEVSTPAPQSGAGGSVNAAQQKAYQIDWTKVPTADNPESANQLVGYINTLDKDLSAEEILKAVREQFGVNSAITNAQLKEYIDLSKQLYATLNPDAGVQTEDDGASDVILTDKIEQLAAEFIKENPEIPNNIDDIIFALKTKKPEELSAVGKQLLAELNAQNKKNETIAPDADVTKELESTELTKKNFVADTKVLFSAEFRKKTPEQQFEYVMDSYLTQNDPEYAKLTDKNAKKAYLKEKQGELVAIMAKIYPEVQKGDMKSYAMKAMLLLQASHMENKPLSEYSAYSKEQLEDVVNTTMNKVVASMIDIEALTDKKLPANERMKILVDSVLSFSDPEYAKLSDAQKDQKRKEVMNKFLDLLGLNYEDLAENKKFAEMGVEAIMGFIGTILTDVKDRGIPISEIMAKYSQDPAKLMEAFAKYTMAAIDNGDGGFKDVPEPQRKEFKNVIEQKQNLLRNVNNIANALGVPAKDLTADQCLKWIEEQRQKGVELDESLLKLEKTLQLLRQNAPDLAGKPGSVIMFGTPSNTQMRAVQLGQSVEQIVADDAERYIKLGLDNPAMIHNMLKQYATDPDGLGLLGQALIDKGVSPQRVAKLLDKARIHAYCLAYSAGHNRGADLTKTGQNAQKFGSLKDVEMTQNIIQKMNEYLDIEQAGECAVTLCQDPEAYNLYKKSVAIGINNYDVKDATDILNLVGASEDVSDGVKASLTEKTVEMASAERQVYYGRELSKSGNEAVLEGLAAASESVDSSVRSQYTSYVATAASQCSPEAQARINTAMQTGEISEQTRNSTVTTPQVEQDFRTHETGKTSVNEISTPVVTKPTVNVNYDVVTSALKNKKEVLAEKITSISEEIKTEVREREEVVTQEVVDELDEILGAVEEGTVTDDMQSKLKVIIETEDLVGLYTKLSSIKGGGILKQFIAALTSYATHHQVLSFATSLRADSGLMEELFHQASGALQEKLIKAGILSESLVYKLLENGALSTLDGIDGKLIYRFVLDHLHDIGINGLAKYWAYIPWEKQQELLTKLNEMRGVTVETSSVEEDGRTEVNDKPQELAQVNSTTLQTSTTDNNMPEGGKVGQKDKSDSTPVSMNPELDSPDDMFSNPLLKKDKVEGDSPDGKKTRLQIQEETGYTYIQQQRNAGVIHGSDDWAKLDKQAKNYKPLAYEPSQDDNDGFSGILGGKQVPHWKRLNKFNLKF